MATPNYDALHVRFSRMISDPVDAATTDGKRYSGTLRDHYFNAGIRQWIRKKIQNKDWEPLRGYIRTGAGTLNSSKVLSITSFSPAVDKILSVYDTTKTKYVTPIPAGVDRYELENPASALVSGFYYAIENNDLLIIGAAASDSVKVEYVAQHSNLAANGGSEVPVFDAEWSITGTTVTGFTGVIATHVGGIFVGTDSGTTKFSTPITQYVSTTSFKVVSSSIAAGTGTNGYIVPPNQSDILVPSTHWKEVLDEAFKIFAEEWPREFNVIRAQAKGQ